MKYLPIIFLILGLGLSSFTSSKLTVNQIQKEDLPDGYMAGYLLTKDEIIKIVNNAPWYVKIDPSDDGEQIPETVGTEPTFAGLTNHVIVTLQQSGFSAFFESKQFQPGMQGEYAGYYDALTDFRLAMNINGFRY